MDWEVVWTEAALADLEAAVRSAARYSTASAEELRDAMFAATDVLVRLPEIGALYEDDPSGRTREIFCRNYRIFYRLQTADNRVNIILVRHAAQRIPRMPSN